MINPKKELFKWGPIDGKLIYIDYFMRPMLDFKDYLTASWPDIITFVRKDKVLCIADDSELRKNGEILFNYHILNVEEEQDNFKEWMEQIDRLVSLQKTITKKNLRMLDNKRFKSLFYEWDRIYVRFWVLSYLYEIANWGGESILRKKLEDKQDFIEIFEALAAPEDLSFFQREELKLFSLKLIKDKKLFSERLKEHQANYFWLHNSYAGSKSISIEYFRKRISGISASEAAKRIKQIESIPYNALKKKREMVKKYNLGYEIPIIAKKLSYCIWCQDYRKQYIFMANHYIDLFLSEIERRYKIDFKELCYYTGKELISLLKNNIRIKDVKSRFDGFVEELAEKEGFVFYSGDAGLKFIKPYTEGKIDANTSEFKGIVVSRGKATGKVKILLSPKNLNKFKNGNILVAPMTSPDYIIAIKKAAAIITDEGGMTSHAAIVSRELKKPCIVGTRIATRVLKDNDIVEVDADKGVVRKIR